jgi:muramoyltetrapeptide carboxypeptidase
MQLKRPKPLQQGDTVGLLSTSAPMAGLVPHRLQAAHAALEEMGFHVRIAPNAEVITDYTAGTPQQRADDVHALFEDPAVTAIISCIGGNHTNHVLPLLDYELIARNPKVVTGYSDMTVLHLALASHAGLQTFYGPAAITQFAEYPEPLSYTLEYFKRAVMQDDPIGAIEPSEEWTDEILDWFKQEDQTRPRTTHENEGYQWLREGSAEGPLMGGCISSLMHLRGTPYWPDMSGALLFLDTPESEADFRTGEDVATIDAQLTDLYLSGVLHQISGLIVGRPFGYTQQQREEFKTLLRDRTREFAFPILFNVNIGHADPIATIPYGAAAHIDSNTNTFRITTT